jgi:hypothetical protein
MAQPAGDGIQDARLRSLGQGIWHGAILLGDRCKVADRGVTFSADIPLGRKSYTPGVTFFSSSTAAMEGEEEFRQS